MKSKLFGALVIMALALAINANAQIKARADVPFSFMVGEKALPAATYQVEDVAVNAILIEGGHNGEAAMIQFHAAEARDNQSPKLVFHKYGDRYFLYQVWYGERRGMELRESKYEKELKLAGNQGSAPQEVVVALR
jgi:hypothetical protein